MVQIIDRGPSVGGNIGSAIGRGLSSGLEALAQHRVDRMTEEKDAQKFAKILKQFNPQLTDQEAYNFSKAPEFLQKELIERGLISTGQQSQQQPEYGVEALNQQQQIEPRQFSLGSKKSKESSILKRDQYNDKLRQDIDYLDDLEGTLGALEGEISNEKDPVKFNPLANLASKYEGGKHFLNASTGSFDALSNKFHTDAAQGQKGVRSVYHVKILGASKPGLDKTREQNQKIINHWKKVIDEKRKRFYKDHPEFAAKKTEDQQKELNMENSQEPRLGSVRVKDGQKQAWNPELKQWANAEW